MSDVLMRDELYEQLIRFCIDALPHKSYGLVGGKDICHPATLYPCSTNLRNTPEWQHIFESFGEFYQNPDLGFVISPHEVQEVMDAMDARGEIFTGVFHSHRFLRAVPSEIDIFLSSDINSLSYIVSVADPSTPEVGVFRINGSGYQDFTIVRY